MKPEVALTALLGALFSESELRTHLAAGHGGDELTDHLPGPPISPAGLREAAVVALRNRGLVDRAFFDRLAQVRPLRIAKIREVRALWLAKLELDEAVDLPSPHRAEVLFVFASEDADLRNVLDPQLALHVAAGDLAVTNVMIAPEEDWEATLARGADGCIACVFIDSPILRTSAHVGSPGLSRLAARAQSGQLCPLILLGRPMQVDPTTPGIIAAARMPLRGRPPLCEMGAEERLRAAIDVAVGLVDIARAHALAVRLIALHTRNCELLDWWRRHSPLGRPDPAEGAGPFVELAWAVAMDLSQRATCIAATRPNPGTRERGPLVRVSLDPVPGREDAWTLRAWYLDSSGMHAISIADPIISHDTLGELLQRIFHAGSPSPLCIDRLELVCDVLGRDWPVDEWSVDDGLGAISFPAPITLRERIRHQRPQLRKILAQRTAAFWHNPARPLLGPGGAGCFAPSLCLDAAVVKDEATRRLQHSAAVCAGLLQLPPAGPHRFARLAEVLRWGLPVAIWSRSSDSAVDDGLREFLSNVEIERLPAAVYKRRCMTMPEAPSGGHFSLLYEDPEHPLPDDLLTSPI